MSESEAKKVLKQREEAMLNSLNPNHESGGMTTANSKGVRQRNLSFLDNPVDPSLSKCLFREDDPLLRFYEHKYKFPLKDIRPFAQHTAT
jgi:hypothetical protein